MSELMGQHRGLKHMGIKLNYSNRMRVYSSMEGSGMPGYVSLNVKFIALEWTYSGPLRANTVLCLFNTIQPYSLMLFVELFR